MPASGTRQFASYERLRIALIRDLGIRHDPETRALYDPCTAGVRVGEPVFVGREVELAQAAALLRSVADGGTSALLVRGAFGIGKSAFCREVAARARADGWRVISVAARSRPRAVRTARRRCRAAARARAPRAGGAAAARALDHRRGHRARAAGASA
jgi:hypothetical protein